MARSPRNRPQQSSNGVDLNGGKTDTGSAASPADNASSGSGDNSGDGDGGNVISPKLGNGDGTDNGDGGTGGGEPRRGRGRPAGSATKKKAEISVTSLAEVIAFAHVGIATVFKNDAWALDEGESKRLAEAAAKVLRHYDTPAISAQAMDWIGLLMVAGNIYGPRIALAVADRPARPVRAPRTASEPGNPVAQQEDGSVIISDPMGSGKVFRMPAQN